MVLFALNRPLWEKADWHRRKDTVERLTDQEVLTEIATIDPDATVREDAVAKLTDQAILAEIAMTDRDDDVCIRAVKGITDQVMLVELILTENPAQTSHWRIGVAAVERITDQALLAEVAFSNLFYPVRLEAIAKLTDINVLMHVEATAVPSEVTRAALNRWIELTVKKS